MYIQENHTIDGSWHYPGFQASTDALGKYCTVCLKFAKTVSLKTSHHKGKHVFFITLYGDR